MSLNCSSKLVNSGLIVDIDFSRLNTFTTGSSILSVNKWSGAYSGNFTLPEYGLTMYDNGFTDNILDEKEFTSNDVYLELKPIGFNTGDTGTTQYDNYNTSFIIDNQVGNYLSLNGGYVQGFYRLRNYDFSILPPRYENGITIQTLINISGNSSGIFYYMGLRAEDKYNDFYTGECQMITLSGDNALYQPTGFTGIITSENHYLNAYVISKAYKPAFQKFEEMSFDKPIIVDQKDNLKSNAICFGINDDKTIFFKYIDDNCAIITNSSNNQIQTGWNLIDIVFKPYNDLKDYDPNRFFINNRRDGDLLIYVNGKLFWKVENFKEFYFRCISNDREKIIGVPFNISWGGGSFGLKHSYHFSDFTKTPTGLTTDVNKTDLLIQNNFDDSFIGDIQKLQIYNRYLNSEEIKHNAKIIMANINYNVVLTNGGRLIYE